jgi:hypothetical protein
MSDRTSSILTLIDLITRGEHPRELFALVMDAFASLYGADARLYRHDATENFVLIDARRGPGGRAEPAQRFSDRVVPTSNQVFRLTGILDLFGGPKGIDTLFAPFGVDDATEWLLVVSAESDPTLEPTLTLVWRLLNQRLAALERESIDRFRRRLGEILSFSDPPFYTVVRMALEAVSVEVHAQSAQIVIFGRHGGASKLAVTYGRTDGAPSDGGGTAEPGANITARMAIGRTLIMVLDVRQAALDRPASAERLTRLTCSELRLWLSGVLLKRTDLTSLVEEEFSAQFVQRVHGAQEQTPTPVPIDGAVVVVLPENLQHTSAGMGEIIDVMQQQLRSADLIGPIDSEGAWVLLPGASSEVSSAIMARLSRAARSMGAPAVKMGVAIFGPSQEAPEQLLQRALVNARAAPPM